MSGEKETQTQLMTPEQARRRRNLATALAIVGFIVLVFFVTMARIKGNVLERPF